MLRENHNAVRRFVYGVGSVASLLALMAGGCPSDPSAELGSQPQTNSTVVAGASAVNDGTTNGGTNTGNTFSPAFVSNPSSASSGSSGAGDGNSEPTGGPASPSGSSPTVPDTQDPDPPVVDDANTPIQDPPDPVDPPPPASVLIVTPPLLQFGTHGTQLTFSVRSNGSQSLDYQISESSIWASVSPSTGSSSGEFDTITVTCNRGWLVDYTVTYTDVIHVTASNGESVVVNIETNVPPPTFTPIVSHTVLDFGADVFQIPLTISNADNFSIPFSITADDPWVNLDVITGSVPHAPASIVVHVTVTRCEITWSAGEYFSTVVIWPGGSNATPIEIPVRVELAAMPNDADVADELVSLPPLPKQHLNYACSWRLVDDLSSGLLYEYTRITHSVTAELIASSPQRLSNIVQTCKQVNATSPAIPATISLKYSPYGYYLPPNAPPWYDGPEVQQELDVMASRLNAVKSAWQAANTQHATSILIDSIILNTELWHAKLPDMPGAAEWNEASRLKYDAVYNLCKSIFPSAKVHWYNRGKPIERGGYFTFEEQGDVASCELYFGYDLEALRYRYKKGYEFSQAHGYTPIPWLNLNGGFYSMPNGEGWYLCGPDYPAEYAWQQGLEFNYPGFVPPAGQDPPLNVAPVIAIYPAMFPNSQPHFAMYFIAYVKGAANIPLNP